METPEIIPLAVELNLRCSGQAHPNRPGTGRGYKHMEPGSIRTILRLSFLVCSLRSMDAKSDKVVQKISHS